MSAYWLAQILTYIQAPFVINGYNDKEPFALPEAKQECPLLRVMGQNALILREITHLLSQKHDSLWKFSATSQASLRLISREIVSISHVGQ